MGLLEDVGARNVFHGVSAFVSYEGRNAVPLCAAENSIIHGKGNRARERRNKQKIKKYKNHLVKSKENTGAYLQVGKAEIMFQTQ